MNESNNQSKKLAVGTVLLLLLSLVVAWGMGWMKKDPVARATADFNELMESDLTEVSGTFETETGEKLNLPPDAKVKFVKAGEKLADSLGKLDEDQMQDFARGMIPKAMEEGRRQAQRVLDLPPKEQRKALDEMIDRNREMKKKFGDQLKGRKPGADMSVEKGEDGNSVEIQQTVTIDGSGTDGQRMMLDMTTPEQRATMDELKELMHQRMIERGLDPEEGGGQMIMMGFETSDEITIEE